MDKNTLVINEIPYGTNTSSLIDSILKANDNGKIIPQRVTNMSRSIHTKITKAIKQARFLSLI